jgi:hypothetical protein
MCLIPDNEFKNFVVGTLKRSGYNLQDFDSNSITIYQRTLHINENIPESNLVTESCLNKNVPKAVGYCILNLMIETNVLVVSDLLHTAEIVSKPQTFDGAEEIFMLHDF